MGALRVRFKSKRQSVDHGGVRRDCGGHDDRLNAPSGRHYSSVPSESPQEKPHSPIAGETPSSPDVHTSSSHSVAVKRRAGLKSSKLDAEKRYLGVRVKMPVKDMLRTIRLAKGLDPQGSHGKCSKGEKRRVNTKGERRGDNKKNSIKSLEELAFIVEVLEEDLKRNPPTTLIFPLSPEYSPLPHPLSPGYSPPPHPLSPGYSPPPLSPGYSPPIQPLSPGYSPPIQPLSPGYSPLSPKYSPCSQPLSPVYSPDPSESTWSPEALFSYHLKSPQQSDLPLDHPSPGLPLSRSLSTALNQLSPLGGYNSEGSDDMISSPGSYMSYSPSLSEYQVPSPPSTTPDVGYQAWNDTAFFWNQLQHEGNLIREVSDSHLLDTDENGQIALHRAVTEGRRALVYAIAKRMAALNSLDFKDSEGKSALHLAAQNNQHMIVEDLVRMGATANETDRSGKTCMHLSAENGYIRVVEVLMKLMKEGFYVDLEATDKYGLNVLQCAAVSLKLTLRELERSVSPGRTRLQTLRKEQIMETLEYLLQMDNYTLDQGFGVDPFPQGSSMEPFSPTQGGFPMVSMEPYRPTQGGVPKASMYQGVRMF
ncbi:NF-kappa-B inhibitor zeta [Hypomesus transpacificus]|uniref:NF-kappa-B inhibitor zeta n=1 Tax=Hypomesus transpacificus TaxID=137520 RepID=UPI001F073DDC|nr:NF-kappa-B inhibitor zeta [Hypomesus transpacificus]